MQLLLSNYLPFDKNIAFLVFQGGELARRSALQNGDVYTKFYYDDARTMYESFLRGLRVSSTYVPSVC